MTILSLQRAFPFFLGLCSYLFVSVASSALPVARTGQPNVILFFMDDMGYADPGCYAADPGVDRGYSTPNMDRLAKEGVKFTDFYVSSAVCSASRAALLTGCYHERISMRGALGPGAPTGLALAETTIAEMLLKQGYATGMVGKWHLGDRISVLPNAQGFQQYYGLPYSNDMWPPNSLRGNWPPLPLWENTTVTNPNVDATAADLLPTEYAKRAVSFIEKHQDKPFFLYFAHNMPHVPLAVHPERRGKSKAGFYGDVMQEIDWTVGQVLQALDRLKLAENTLVLLTSDNGPWEVYGHHGGSDGGLREGKGTSFEGGVRVPFLARFPGKIPAGSTSREIAGTIDVLPTIAEATGAALPDRVIDGKTIWPLLQQPASAKSPHEALFFYYANNQLQGMRSGPWKMYFPHKSLSNEVAAAKPGVDGAIGRSGSIVVGTELYHLGQDPQEKKNVSAEQPEVIKKLNTLADAIRSDLGDSITGVKGKSVRPAERLPTASPKS